MKFAFTVTTFCFAASSENRTTACFKYYSTCHSQPTVSWHRNTWTTWGWTLWGTVHSWWNLLKPTALTWCCWSTILAVHDRKVHSIVKHSSGSAHDCGNSSALALELPQSCAEPLIGFCPCITLFVCYKMLSILDIMWFFLDEVPSNLSYKTHSSRQLNCWWLRCSWNIACGCCSNYIFILNLTPGFNRLGKDNCKTRQETV